RTLITADDPAGLARRIDEDGLSVREAEALSPQRPGTRRRSAAAPRERDAYTWSLERRLSDLLGLRVTIDHKGESGRIEIRYRTFEQLDLITLRLTGHNG